MKINKDKTAGLSAEGIVQGVPQNFSESHELSGVQCARLVLWQKMKSELSCMGRGSLQARASTRNHA